MPAARKRTGAVKAAPSSAPDISELVAQAVAAAVAPVMAELAEVKAQAQLAPRFKPMEKEGLTDRFHGVKKGEQKDGVGDRMLQGANSHALPAHVLYNNRPLFEAGQQVRLNLDAVREGSDAPWATVLAKAPNADGYGEIIRKDYFNEKRGVWKYHVKFKGLTTRLGDGFDEYELLPA